MEQLDAIFSSNKRVYLEIEYSETCKIRRSEYPEMCKIRRSDMLKLVK